MIKTIRQYIYTLVLLGTFLTSKEVIAQEVNIVQYSIAQGLPQSQVNKIIFDSRGMLWAATSGGGISIFDGVTFTTFDENCGLAGNIVQDIVEDIDGRILCVSTWGGISVIDHNQVTKVIPYPEDATGVNAIERDAYGVIWIGGSSISFLQDDQFIPIVTDVGLPFINEVTLKSFGDRLFVTSNNRLIMVDVVTKQQVYSKSYPFNINVAHQDVGNPEILYLGTSEGLYKEYKGVIEKVDLPHSKFSNTVEITDIVQESNSKIWFASRNGVYSMEKGITEFYAENQGLGHYDFTSICFDSQGSIWFGSRGEGVFGIVNTPFSFYSNVKGLKKSDNFPILEDQQGRLWVGNNEEGVFIYDGDEVISLNASMGLSGNQVRGLAVRSDGDVFVATNKGLSLVAAENFKIQVIESYDNMFVKTLLIDEFDNLYVGTIGDGLWWHDASGKKDSLLFADSVTNVHSLCFDKNHNLVVGTNDGVYLKYNGTYSYYRNSLKNVFIGNLCLDRNGKLWCGTDRSISRFDNGTFVNYDVANGLTSDLVYILFSDSQGFLWVGTNKGLDRIAIDNNSEIIKVKHYGFKEGFKGIEVNSRGFCESKDSSIYFSTVEGLHRYSPKFDFNYSYNTPVYLNGLRLFLEPLIVPGIEKGTRNWFNVPDEITLEFDQNHLTFDFFAVDYLSPEGVEYTYFLEGFDKHWSPPTKSRYAVYSNLPHGTYTFKVKQAGNDFSQIATIRIHIKKAPPPFYRSVWFLILVTVFFGLLVYYFTEYRTAKLKNQQSYLESKIEERTQEIKESEKEKTILLQEVHHRVKNNLQIIISLFRLQTYFTENEEAIELFKNSQNRIRTMSKIHEKLYQTRDLGKIDIDVYIKELIDDIVSSYDISNKVKILLDVQKCNITLDELTPLALIVNEIITNSMKYGLKAIDHPVISISLKQNVDGTTTLLLSDNGPGFDEKIWEEHGSMGIELIKTLTEQLNGKIELFFEEGHPHFKLIFKASLKNK